MNKKYSLKWLKESYRDLIRPRMVEERMLLLLKQGGISKWFSGIGQEAIAVGATAAFERDEFILPLHRNLGVFLKRGVPLHRLFSQYMGKRNGYTNGRDRSHHFSTLDHKIIGMISHLGPHFCTALGIALSHKLRGEEKVVLALGGDGLTSEGDFHEALNVAAVWELPVLFLVENNGYALSTPISQQFACSKLSSRAAGYGMEGKTIDGNDFFQVYETVRDARRQILKHGCPFLLECRTFRMRGHEEASGVKYVPKELMAEWEKKDPIARFEKQLLHFSTVDEASLEAVKDEIKASVEAELERAFADELPVSSPEIEERAVFAHFSPPPTSLNGANSTKELRFVDAVREGLYQALEKDPELILMGQDVADYGGVFKVSEGFVEEFGRERIRNTPLCESAIVGAGLGLAITGTRSVIEMQFSDFASSAFTQITNNLSKMHYRSNIPVPTVIRMPCGGGVGAGPFHSQTKEAWFLHSPGLRIAYPSTPVDAKGMLLTAIDDPNPVLYFEHKLLYRREKEEVPEEAYHTPFTAKFVSKGHSLSIITYGAGVRWAKEFAEQNAELSLTILDLRWLNPLDYEAIEEAVELTGKVAVLHEAQEFAGFGGEIASYIGEHLFHLLDAPVIRIGSLETPVPFEKGLEEQYLASSRMRDELLALNAY